MSVLLLKSKRIKLKKNNFLKVRDEKAQLNRRVDGLGERLLNRTSQLEELASRLKEFEEGRQAVERRLEAAKHQIEVQEALGPQVLKLIGPLHAYLCSFD